MRNLFKKGISAVIALSMAASMAVMIPITASAADASGDFGTNNALHWEISGTTLTISGTGKIPDYTSTALGDRPWNDEAEEITSVVIESGITRVGSYSFSYCSNLTSVSLPDTVTDIAQSVFLYCTSLTGLTIPDSVTVIRSNAFDSSGLKSATVPDSVKTFGGTVFNNCPNLESVHLGKNMPKVNSNILFISLSLKTITVDAENTNMIVGEDGVLYDTNKTEILGYPHGNANTEYTVPSTVTTIGQAVFPGSRNLLKINVEEGNTNYYTDDQGVLYTDDAEKGKTLVYCPSGKTSVTIPNDVKNIANRAFSYSNLQSVTIPESVTAIGLGAFTNSAIESLTIPSTVESIDNEMARNCPNLKTLTIKENENRTTIPSKLCEKCPALETVNLPDNITEVADNAFSNVNETAVVNYNGESDTVASNIARQAVLESSNVSYTVTAPTTAGTNEYSKGTFKAWADGDTVGAMGFISTITGGSVPESFKTTNDKGADTTAVKTAVDKITWTITIGEKQYQKTFNGTTVSLDADGQATIKVLIDGFDETQYNAGITAVSTSLD